MKIIIVMIMLLYSNYTMASERISLVDKKLSQGYVAPILTENSVILPDKNGTLYSFDIDNPRVINWKLYLSSRKKLVI